MSKLKLRHLITTGAQEAEMIKALLEDNEIAVIEKHHEVGAYANIYMGFSAFNVELYTSVEDYKEAKKLVSELEFVDDQMLREEAENSDQDKEVSYYLKNAAKIIIILFLLISFFFLFI
ncbi:putative signal transducing protein [Halanaerobium hydrogeniformans]|uniref:Uncharacterized protein n=1 Tax=Halanaerobium hydrogeniformans TaxID=656519 RepID=E4RNT3_HALHG|nr:DUF2007 domain-containing protein [Halanaerobium hydrogeniformans]ADQ13761.1 hypothetical protein Halsa_0284 [Halanaerobium hydrogeniformans]